MPPKPPVGWRVARILGAARDPARRLGVRFTRRFYVFALFLILLGGGAAFVDYSTSPSFCSSCHIMVPYYEAWKASKHKDVACIECHYPPGSPRTILWKKFQALSQVVKYVTRTYSSKPYAEVEDASCLRSGCHSQRLLQGKVLTAKGIHFDHRPHIESVRAGRQLRCVSCHSQVVVGKHIEVTYDTCFLCHLKGRQQAREVAVLGGCTGCHDVPEREIKVGNITYSHRDFLSRNLVPCQECHQDTIQGEGEVTEDRCYVCHNQPEKLARFKDIPFIHDNHVTRHNTACFHCHKEIRHGKTAAGTKTLNYECSLCHTDQHDLQKQMYKGVGAKGVPSMPSPMYLANVDCVGCHVEKLPPRDALTRAETYVGSEKGCTACHGAEYVGIMDAVHSLMRCTEARLEENLALVAKARIETAPQEASAALAEADWNLRFLRRGHSMHNIYYASQVLRYTDAQIKVAAAKMQVKLADTSALPVITGGFCATLCHPRVGVKVPAEVVKYKGRDMPHRTHIENGMPCTQCHVFGAHKDVRLREDANCFDCHETKDLDGK